MKVSQYRDEVAHLDLESRIQKFKNSLRTQQMIEWFTRCALCHGALEFLHRTDGPHIVEQAHCPSCQKSAPERTYRCH